MEKTYNSIKEKFIPHTVMSFSNIRKVKLMMENDSFSKYEAITEVKGEYIICKDTTKLKKYGKRIIKETYEEYLEFISERGYDNDRWIYNIIDDVAERDNILYRDEHCIVIPTYTWDSNNINKLHILCLSTDISLRTIRDLTFKNVSLLEHMKKVTLQQIEEKYGLREENLKIFFHYEPSTYHLHIHFINVGYTECMSSVEYSHDLDIVIFNLTLYSDYYKTINLNRRI